MNKTIHIPYGRKHLQINIPLQNLQEVVEPNFLPSSDEAEAVRKALSNPIGSGTLKELTKDAKKVLILSNDNTRPMPSQKTIPLIIGQFFILKHIMTLPF